MSKRDDFQKTMEENFALWGARLATIKSKLSAETKAEGKAADDKKLADLRGRCDAAIGMLSVLKATQGDQWDVLAQAMAKEWHDLDAIMTQGEQAVRAHDDAAKTAASTSTPPAAPEPPSVNP
jgi:hypothetical protein